MADDNAASLVEVGVLIPAILSAALPSLFTMRQFAHNDAAKADLRLGEVVGGSMVLILGIAMSVHQHSPVPLVVIVIIGGAWFAIIEWAIRNPRNGTEITSGQPPVGNTTQTQIATAATNSSVRII